MKLKELWPVCLLMIIIGIYFYYFNSRYIIASNSTASNCLQASVFLVDTWDKEVGVNDLAAFVMNKPNKVYPLGGKWIKQVVATQGMTVHVFEDKVTISDGRTIQNGMTHVLSFLQQTIADIEPVHTLSTGQLFMMGDTKTTYDSRYWGAITTQNVLGKAYAIF